MGIFVIVDDGDSIEEIEQPTTDSAISLYKWFVFECA
jgi:hypothetical protein